MYKKSHTKSTKCQYQQDASNPKWWNLEKWKKFCRKNITKIKIVPKITCNPWNPVPIKNTEP